MESIVPRYHVDRKKWNNECNSLHTKKSARLMQAAELQLSLFSILPLTLTKVDNCFDRGLALLLMKP